MALWEGGRHWRGRPAEESRSLGYVPGICVLSSDFLSHSSPPVFHEMRRLASLHVPWCSTLPPMTTRRYTERKSWSKRAKTMMESLQVYITRKPLATEFLFQNLYWEVSVFGTVFFQFDWWVLSHSGPDSCLTGQWSSNSLLFSWSMTGEEWVDWTQGCWFQFHLILLVDKSQEGRIHWRFLEKMYFLIKDPQDEQAKWFPVFCSPNGSLNYMPRNRPKSFLKGFLKIWSNPCPFTGALTISV